VLISELQSALYDNMQINLPLTDSFSQTITERAYRQKRQSLYSCDHVLARSRLPVILNIDNE
jgi:hypothetical protein